MEDLKWRYFCENVGRHNFEELFDFNKNIYIPAAIKLKLSFSLYALNMTGFPEMGLTEKA